MIRAGKAIFPVRLMCRSLSVAPSSYYAWESREADRERKRNEERLIVEAARKSHAESRGTYGRPRIARDLKDEGVKVGKHRLGRLMKENAIVGCPKKKWKATTDSAHKQPVAENTLDRAFAVDEPNTAWVGDITYIWTYQGWSYLATVIDLYSRRVVGWALDTHMQTELVLNALNMALNQRDVKPGLIFHSDRGSQYASDSFQKALKDAGIVSSMSRKGNCWDNAVAESFFSSIKRELIYKASWFSHQSLRTAVYEYIEVFYNRKRRHSANDYLAPVDYENCCLQQKDVAA